MLNQYMAIVDIKMKSNEYICISAIFTKVMVSEVCRGTRRLNSSSLSELFKHKMADLGYPEAKYVCMAYICFLCQGSYSTI